MPDAPTEKIQYWIDRSEILDCINRCARGMDRHDAEMIASAYHADAIDHHGRFVGSPAEFIKHVNGSDAGPGVHEQMFTDHMHYLGNHTCDIDGEVAHAETYYSMIGRHRHAESVSIWTGRYVDRLEKRGGKWAIAARHVVMGEAAVTLPAAKASSFPFVKGTWDRTDISYQRPLAD